MVLYQCPWQSSLTAALEETYIENLEQHMAPSEVHIFHGCPWIIQQDNAKTTFCTDTKGMAEEDEDMKTGLHSCAPHDREKWRLCKEECNYDKTVLLHISKCETK